MKGGQVGAPLFYLHLPLAAFLSGFFPPAGVLPAKESSSSYKLGVYSNEATGKKKSNSISKS